MLPVQGAQVQSLVRQPDPTCYNLKSSHAATKTWLSQINTKKITQKTKWQVTISLQYNCNMSSPREHLTTTGVPFLCSTWYYKLHLLLSAFSFWASLLAQMVKNLPAMQETRVQSWVGKIPWRREWQPTSVFLPGESTTEEPGGHQSVR